MTKPRYYFFCTFQTNTAFVQQAGQAKYHVLARAFLLIILHLNNDLFDVSIGQTGFVAVHSGHSRMDSAFHPVKSFLSFETV